MMRGFAVLEALKDGKKVTCTSWGDNNHMRFDEYNNVIRDIKGNPVDVGINYLFSREWEIYKEYVSFTEAMKALEEGYCVRAHDGIGFYEIDPVRNFQELGKDYPTASIHELSLMKWTIES